MCCYRAYGDPFIYTQKPYYLQLELLRFIYPWGRVLVRSTIDPVWERTERRFCFRQQWGEIWASNLSKEMHSLLHPGPSAHRALLYHYNPYNGSRDTWISLGSTIKCDVGRSIDIFMVQKTLEQNIGHCCPWQHQWWAGLWIPMISTENSWGTFFQNVSQSCETHTTLIYANKWFMLIQRQ